MPRINKRSLTCETCGNNVVKLRRHALRAHMPWYMDPSTACVDCQVSEGCGRDLELFHSRHQRVVGDTLLQAWFLLMGGLFRFVMGELSLGSPDDLLGFVVTNGLFPTTFRFSEDECFFFREFDRRSGLEPLTTDGYMLIPPARLIVLSNYTIMTRLLSLVNQAAQKAFKSVVQYVRLDGSSPPSGFPRMKVGISDSHFHLDRFTCRSTTTLSDLERSAKPATNLLFGITNYVFPGKWPKIDRQMKDEPRLRFTLGIHPHVLVKGGATSEFDKLKAKFEEYPQAVGIGEIGLDLTATCRCSQPHNKSRCRQAKIDTQCQFLRLVLQWAKTLGKVIVLHIRENGDSGNAAKEVLTLLLELGLNEAYIHRHCFMGGIEEYTQWSSSLPNCFFSLSKKSLTDEKTVACLQSVEKLDRLLLETDSPYLAGNPWTIYSTGEGAARIMGLETMELVRACNKNVARLYDLPW